MRLPRMTIRRWMVVAVVATVFVVALALIVAPIHRDVQEREDDARWIRKDGGY
jgi:hypothetical protein